ncbi:MAG TPA: hypothetical protein VE270_02050 [Thermoleophilaceae bacterium]|jgi:heme-degrading monooxygenase HmoA|nr:hypothetical protein [Thermoleophilaceae bacterium]
MHARLSRFAGLDPERIDATVRQFEEEALPQLEEQEGFRGITVGVNHRAGQAVAIAFWETEADMRESEKLAAEAREQAVTTAGPQRTPVVDNYDVVLHRPVASGSPSASQS